MEPTAITFDDEEEAGATRSSLEAAGFRAEVVKERFHGEDDDEELVFVVLTDAPAADARELIQGDGWL